MSRSRLIGEAARHAKGGNVALFETRDFYLACFLRCSGYELLDLRTEGPRKGLRSRQHIASLDAFPDLQGHLARLLQEQPELSWDAAVTEMARMQTGPDSDRHCDEA